MKAEKLNDNMQAKIIETAKGYLIENFGNLTSIGYISTKKNDTWRVKIVVKTNRGIIPVGELVFDTKSFKYK